MIAKGADERSTSGPAKAQLSVGVIIPVRNERKRLPVLLESLELQNLRPSEVVIADGASVDGSREWLEEVASTRPWLRVVDNPAVVIPSALNLAITACDCDIVARMDAHAEYEPEYLERIVEFLTEHPEIAGAGGAMETVGDGSWGGAIAAQLRRPWAMGGARHRVGGDAGPVDHVFCTAYRRDAVMGAGGWDRHMLANEDAELDYRIRKSAGEIWLVPTARSTWRTRTSPRALALQMWRYGYFRARTIHLHPDSFKTRHLAPPALVVGLVGLLLLRPSKGIRAAALYLTAAGAVGALSAKRDGASPWRGGVALPIVHMSWGGGLLAGLIRHWGAQSEPGLSTPAHANSRVDLSSQE